ncbi:MAG: ATP-binding cassette domain-containing protein, partial [Clostridia bacterium]|nr:ATP-binding cassette domain-containing protein [Clostridia bacterium]
MIEIKNLKKIYQTEGLPTVTALNGVSIKFPEKGLVFLLGRSGSGKSTMLNLIGGLDKADEGEIIVKGRSSADFTPADFDSYRNTYVGFIFQDFNILEEFTIAENISLALELQGRDASRKSVDELLELVDLGGLGDRKPNTLSGGQRQRVAIARALIKNPELIMADEPTGALDSKTGQQILDTLQKLSKEKLVLVVSHDREAAEKYADRIIEIADGEIILDKTKEVVCAKTITDNVNLLGDDVITLKDGKNITEAEIAEVVKIIKQSEGESVITLGKKDVPEVKRVCRIKEQRRETFRETKEEDVKEYKGEKPQLIKSKLPLRQALKMGLSGLKAKPFRYGVHIKDMKYLCMDKPIETMPAPEEVWISVSQHIGAPAIPVVEVGDSVKRGQLIAKASGAVSSNVYSSVCGEVV